MPFTDGEPSAGKTRLPSASTSSRFSVRVASVASPGPAFPPPKRAGILLDIACLALDTMPGTCDACPCAVLAALDAMLPALLAALLATPGAFAAAVLASSVALDCAAPAACCTLGWA